VTGPTRPDEGLRERKKRLLRQLISDTATSMFLERGFDAVKVSEIAAACDVSEKTVFNYFPTKESLLFDQEEDLAARIDQGLHAAGDGVPLVDSVLAVLEAQIEEVHDDWATRHDPAGVMSTVRRFSELVETHPALMSALQAMLDRLTQVAAEALADRAGVDSEDPEPQMAGMIVVGLWRTYFQSMRRYAVDDLSVDEVRDALLSDVRRAAQVADSGLSAFNLVVHQATTKEQLRDAADAANEARRQVVSAVKQARDVWRQVLADTQQRAAADLAADRADDARSGRRMTKAEERARKLEMKRELRERAREMQREMHRELRQQQREMHEELRGRRGRGAASGGAADGGRGGRGRRAR
jgi:AcrR family transcriptional regulator